MASIRLVLLFTDVFLLVWWCRQTTAVILALTTYSMASSCECLRFVNMDGEFSFDSSQTEKDPKLQRSCCS